MISLAFFDISEPNSEPKGEPHAGSSEPSSEPKGEPHAGSSEPGNVTSDYFDWSEISNKSTLFPEPNSEAESEPIANSEAGK